MYRKKVTGVKECVYVTTVCSFLFKYWNIEHKVLDIRKDSIIFLAYESSKVFFLRGTAVKYDLQ